LSSPGRIRGDSRIPQAGTAGKGRWDVVLVNPTDYFLYLPLLPEVEAGS
jgi:NADH dehydrogenase FAD-containing subunit